MLQFVLEARKLVRTVVTTKEESIDAEILEEKELWSLPKSIFAARAKRGPVQCNAKDFFDTPKVIFSCARSYCMSHCPLHVRVWYQAWPSPSTPQPECFLTGCGSDV
jgi:hypothetical protein